MLRANPVLQKLTGGRAVNGVAVSTLVKLDDRLALDALLTAALAGATVPPAAELQLAGDEDLPVSILAWGVREHDGEILSVLIQVDDLRERRRAEAARERLAEERAGRAKAEAAYERERTIASTLQRDLLPRRLPDAPGVALAVALLGRRRGHRRGRRLVRRLHAARRAAGPRHRRRRRAAAWPPPRAWASCAASRAPTRSRATRRRASSRG